METPMIEKTLEKWSMRLFLCTADKTPKIIPVTTEKNIENKANSRVAGKKVTISSITGLLVMIDTPKSPCKIPYM